MDWVRQQAFDSETLRLHGCGLAAGINGMVKASGGKWKPRGNDGTGTARSLLARSGATDAEFAARGLTSRELAQALDTVGEDSPEWMPLMLKAYHGGLVTEMLDKMVEVKGSLLVAVRNKVLVKAGKTRFPGFDGGHWGVVTARVGSDVRWIAGEKAPITLSVKVLTAAADQFGDKTDVGLADDSWGDGRGEAILVYPWRTWEQGYANMRRERDNALGRLDASRELLAQCRTDLAECEADGGATEEQLKAARQSGIDAAAERARTTPNP